VERANGRPVTLAQTIDWIGDRCHATLLTIFSLPFCFPVSIPGLSTPFGAMIALLGVYLTLNRRPWIPEFVGRREVSFETLTKLAAKAQWAIKKLERWLHPRYEILCVHPVLHKLHGITIVVLAVILMLPLPLPLSNTVAAIPIFLIALGMLEEDGGFVIAGYLATIATAAYYGLLLWMGVEGFRKLFGL
jgi:hypothetical protein